MWQNVRDVWQTNVEIRESYRVMDDKSYIDQLRDIHSLLGSHYASYCLDDKMGGVFSIHGCEKL